MADPEGIIEFGETPPSLNLGGQIIVGGDIPPSINIAGQLAIKGMVPQQLPQIPLNQVPESSQPCGNTQSEGQLPKLLIWGKLIIHLVIPKNNQAGSILRRLPANMIVIEIFFTLLQHNTIDREEYLCNCKDLKVLFS